MARKNYLTLEICTDSVGYVADTHLDERIMSDKDVHSKQLRRHVLNKMWSLVLLKLEEEGLLDPDDDPYPADYGIRPMTISESGTPTFSGKLVIPETMAYTVGDIEDEELYREGATYIGTFASGSLGSAWTPIVDSATTRVLP